MSSDLSRAEHVEDILLQIEERLGDNPVAKLDRLIARRDALQKEIELLKSRLGKIEC